MSNDGGMGYSTELFFFCCILLDWMNYLFMSLPLLFIPLFKSWYLAVRHARYDPKSLLSFFITIIFTNISSLLFATSNERPP